MVFSQPLNLTELFHPWKDREHSRFISVRSCFNKLTGKVFEPNRKPSLSFLMAGIVYKIISEPVQIGAFANREKLC